jgi:hypothetical protein
VRAVRVHLFDVIQVGAESYNAGYHSDPDCGPDINPLRNFTCIAQEDKLQSLRAVVHKNTLALETVLHFNLLSACKNFMTKIAGLIYDLKAEGAEVTVLRQVRIWPHCSCAYKYNDRVHYRNLCLEYVEFDLTKVFEGTFGECLATIKKGIRNVSSQPCDLSVRRA